MKYVVLKNDDREVENTGEELGGLGFIPSTSM
jgi:hypothetical protein